MRRAGGERQQVADGAMSTPRLRRRKKKKKKKRDGPSSKQIRPGTQLQQQQQQQEAVQIEMQARVNQDPVASHESQPRPGLGSASSPATAWPRRTRGAAPSGPKGLRVRTFLCLARSVPEYDSDTVYPACGLCPRLVRMQTGLFCCCCCRSGCMVPTYDPGAGTPGQGDN